jgi:hypothetical protein
MGDKVDWSDGFVRHLFDACKEEIQDGNRPNGNFTTTGWKNLISKFTQKFSDNRTKKQLKNKSKRNIHHLWCSRIVPLVLDGTRQNELLSAPKNGGMNTFL